MPVFVINGDNKFDLPGIARRDGLDLFKSDRVCLIDAIHSPQNSQTERLWDDWPTCLEGNKNNLRAELDRIIEQAQSAVDTNHVILFVVDRFAPDEAQLVSRDILQDVHRKIYARDRRGFATETGDSRQNVWVVVFVRPAQDPDGAAEQARIEKEKCEEIHNIFVSAFNGALSECPASDFATLRVLAELLLDDQESRRFFQPAYQNAFPVAYVFGPNVAPRAGASRVLRLALLGTLNKLLPNDPPASANTAISVPARRLEGLVTDLVAAAKQAVRTPAQMDTASADQRTALILEARSGHTSAAANQGPAERAIDAILSRFMSGLKWRPADRYNDVRRELSAQIELERSEFEERKRTWIRSRPKQHASFVDINRDITRTIEDDLSRVAIGSRGDDIAMVEGLVATLSRERDALIVDANKCYESTNLPEGQRDPLNHLAVVDNALRAFHFELDQVPQSRSVLFYLIVTIIAAVIPYGWLLLTSSLDRPLYALIGVVLSGLVLMAAVLTFDRRQKKLRQAAGKLRDKLAAWRASSVLFFDNALRYQVLTLGVGWLGAAIEKLVQIERSIAARSEALEDCRETLLTAESEVDNDDFVQLLITQGAGRLAKEPWDKWIVKFLTEFRQLDFKIDAIINLANDAGVRKLSVPGLAQPLTIRIQTPTNKP